MSTFKLSIQYNDIYRSEVKKTEIQTSLFQTINEAYHNGGIRQGARGCTSNSVGIFLSISVILVIAIIHPSYNILIPSLIIEKYNLVKVGVPSNLHLKKTRHVFVKHGCPRWQQSQNMAKISKSYILTLPPGVCDVREEGGAHRWTYSTSLVTWSSPNFKYCFLFVSGTELQTNGQTDGRSDY